LAYPKPQFPLTVQSPAVVLAFLQVLMASYFLWYHMRTFERQSSVFGMTKLLALMVTLPSSSSTLGMLLGGDFYAAVQDFFHSGKLLKQINRPIIALVPKLANVSSTSDFRPISCRNVIYKVIAKILVGRLTEVLTDIVSPIQNAFLGGKLMSDNINPPGTP